jgi:hypothetical protein
MESLFKHASRAVVGIGLAGALVSPVAASDVSHFTFSQAEFEPVAEGTQAAQEFVTTELPQGLPLSEAIARVQRAVMSCHASRVDSGAVTCDYFRGATPAGGDQGEDFWELNLRASSDGVLQSVSLSRSHVGVPGDAN